jgi:hypothetical protein
MGAVFARLAPRTWFRIGVAAWAVVLLAAAGYAVGHGQPTVREQTTIVAALPTLDRAIAAVVRAAAGPQAVVSIHGYQRTQARCTAGNRDGERYQRVAHVYTVPGQEGPTVDRVAAALPRSYEAGVRHAAGVHALRADAGFFVQLVGGTDGPGQLRFTADTGCRVRGGSVPTGAADSGTPPAASGALARLGSSEANRRTDEVACDEGGRVRTVTVTAARPARPLPDAAPPGSPPVLARDDLVAYVEAGVGVALRLTGDDLVVTVTGSCQ